MLSPRPVLDTNARSTTKSYLGQNSVFASDRGTNSSSFSGIARLVRPFPRLDATAEPGDNIFLECADAAQADCLITQNVRYFPRFSEAN